MAACLACQVDHDERETSPLQDAPGPAKESVDAAPSLRLSVSSPLIVAHHKAPVGSATVVKPAAAHLTDCCVPYPRPRPDISRSLPPQRTGKSRLLTTEELQLKQAEEERAKLRALHDKVQTKLTSKPD